MTPFPEILADISGHLLPCPSLFCLLLYITLIHRIQCKIGSDIEKDLAELHARRVERVRQSLASPAAQDWNAPTSALRFPFESWVQLMADGSVFVAGQSFRPEQTFQIAARDDRNIPRARVACDGTGNVRISSHGQMFQARFLNTQQWDVQLIQPPHA